jgi:hypothetical protein
MNEPVLPSFTGENVIEVAEPAAEEGAINT